MAFSGPRLDVALPGGRLGRRFRGWQKDVFAVTTASLIAIVGWHVLSIFNKPWVPSPLKVAETVMANLASSSMYEDIGITLFRVLITFICAAFIGSIVGILMGLNRRAEAFFLPLVAIALAVPDPIYIIFSILIIGTGELSAVVALTFAVSPYVVNFVRASVAARDQTLDEMTKVYRVPRWRAFREAVLPQLVPAVLTSTRFSFALSWKLIVIIEALGRSDGIGAGIVRAFRFLRMDEVFALAIIFIVIMQLLEQQVLARIEKRLLRWRA